MTVKELIEELKKYNQDAEVKVQFQDFTQDFSVKIRPNGDKQIAYKDGTVTYKYKVVLQTKETGLMYGFRQP